MPSLDLRENACRYSYSYSTDSYSHADTENCNSSHYSNYRLHEVTAEAHVSQPTAPNTLSVCISIISPTPIMAPRENARR